LEKEDLPVQVMRKKDGDCISWDTEKKWKWLDHLLILLQKFCGDLGKN
jgi:hypothetical protein